MAYDHHQHGAAGVAPHRMHDEHGAAHEPGAGNPQVEPLEYARHPHAFIMVGDEALFLCHMTSLWMLGHTYEVVLRAHVPYDVMQAYRRAVAEPLTRADAERYHAPRTCFLTCFPEPFPLPELLLGRRRFLGQLNRGFPRQLPPRWPWSRERPIKDRIPVEIDRVVYFRHYDYQIGRPASQTYMLFGEHEEAHLYHQQTREPDYDHVASLARAPAWLHPERLRAGVQVSFSALCGCHTPCEDPLAARAEWRVRYQGTGPERDLTVARTHWFSTLVTNSPGAAPCAESPRGAPEHAHAHGDHH